MGAVDLEKGILHVRTSLTNTVDVPLTIFPPWVNGKHLYYDIHMLCLEELSNWSVRTPNVEYVTNQTRLLDKFMAELVWKIDVDKLSSYLASYVPNTPEQEAYVEIQTDLAKDERLKGWQRTLKKVAIYASIIVVIAVALYIVYLVITTRLKGSGKNVITATKY